MKVKYGRHGRGWMSFWLVRIFRMHAAWVLWRQRKCAALSLREAALQAGIEPRTLLKYELGIKSPPLYLIRTLLRQYRADESAILFFCMTRFPMPGLRWHLKMAWSRYH